MVIPYAVFCCCCLDMFSIHLGIYQRAQWFHYMGRVWFSFVRNCQTVFQNFAFLQASCIPMEKNRPAFPPAMNESSCCFTALPAFGVVSILGFCHSNECSDISIVVLIYSLLMTHLVEHLFLCLSYVYMPFVHLLWWDVCWDLWPNFQSSCLFSYCWALRKFCILIDRYQIYVLWMFSTHLWLVRRQFAWYGFLKCRCF